MLSAHAPTFDGFKFFSVYKNSIRPMLDASHLLSSIVIGISASKGY